MLLPDQRSLLGSSVPFLASSLLVLSQTSPEGLPPSPRGRARTLQYELNMMIACAAKHAKQQLIPILCLPALVGLPCLYPKHTETWRVGAKREGPQGLRDL